MSFTQGSLAGQQSDSNHGAASVVAAIDNALNLSSPTQTLSQVYSGATVYNLSGDHLLRITFVLASGSVGPGAQTVPPRGTASLSFDQDVATGYKLEFVAPPAAGSIVLAEALPLAALTGTHSAVVNFINS